MSDYVLIIIVIFVIVLFSLGFILLGFNGFHIESPEKRAGRYGEIFAGKIIREILNEDDILLTNVKISADDKQTELDNVVINQNGVFIIEVKNYSGQLIGDEDDSDWIKNKITPGGNLFQKEVRNPIKQVKRQIYILSRLFKENDISVWIEGYVFLVERNSPVRSTYILDSQYDINRAVHTRESKRISKETMEKIVSILS